MGHGGKRAGAGRPKGAISKASAESKAFMAEFVAGNMADMQVMFDQIKADDPKKAFDILLGSLEYVVPKLSRAELDHSGKVDIHSILAGINEQSGDSETKED